MRLRLVIAYLGTDYSGWQVQPDRPTVQRALEQAVEEIGGRHVRVTGASRTDAGVHAAGQVCHFDPPREMPVREWSRALNALLPADVRVLDAAAAAPDFDARRHARRKRYVYRIDTAPVASPFLAPFAWHRPGLDRIQVMSRGAAGLLVDDLDQRHFASRPDDSRHIRPLEACEVRDVAGCRQPKEFQHLPSIQSGQGSVVTVTVVGRSFLRHAVRGMVGTLVEMAQERRSWEEFQAMVQGTPEHRPLSLKAPAHGLCLDRIDY